MNELIRKIISLHESPQHADRQKGHDLITGLRDPKLIRELSDSLSPQNHSSIRLTLTSLMGKLLKTGDESLLGLSLSILFRYATSEQKDLRTESEKLLEEFFSNPSIFHLRKVYAIRVSWRYLNLSERKVATKRIGIYRYREILPITLENFMTEERDLVGLTIDVFRLLEDKRANRFIRKVLETNSDEVLIVKAIDALSELGFFLDQRYFREFLRSQTHDIAFAAAKALFRSLGDKAIPDLVNLYERLQDNVLKLKIVELLTATPTDKSVEAVLRLWEKADLTPIEHKIEWALNDLDRDIKVKALVRFYPEAPEQLQFKIISLLNEIHHPLCVKFFASVLSDSKHDFLRISAMESLAFYDDEKSMELLKPFLSNREGELHYYALASLVKHSKIDLRPFLEDIVEANYSHDRHYHQLVLSVLQEHTSLKELSPKIVHYVDGMLRSKFKDNRYLAFGVFARFYRQFDWNTVLNLAINEQDDIVLKESRRALARVFSLHPEEFLRELGEGILSFIDEKDFLNSVILSDAVIRSLFRSQRRSAILELQRLHGRYFWSQVYPFILEGSLEYEQVTWIDLSGLSFEEFVHLWQLFLTRVKLRDYLLKSVSFLRDPRFGEFIMQEYLSGRSQEMYPYVSRFINGLP